MSESVLYDVEMSTVDWQLATQNNQEVTAKTVNQAASFLMQLYQAAEKALNEVMAQKPSSKDKHYSTEVNIWETEYNQKSQEWQNLENIWHTPIQALTTQEQSLGNASQEAAQVAAIITQLMKTVASLLQGQM